MVVRGAWIFALFVWACKPRVHSDHCLRLHCDWCSQCVTHTHQVPHTVKDPQGVEDVARLQVRVHVIQAPCVTVDVQLADRGGCHGCKPRQPGCKRQSYGVGIPHTSQQREQCEEAAIGCASCCPLARLLDAIGFTTHTPRINHALAHPHTVLTTCTYSNPICPLIPSRMHPNRSVERGR